VSEYEVKCPKCGIPMRIEAYDYSIMGYGMAVFGICPKCGTVKGLIAKGKIPRELRDALFPGHKEVF